MSGRRSSCEIINWYWHLWIPARSAKGERAKNPQHLKVINVLINMGKLKKFLPNFCTQNITIKCYLSSFALHQQFLLYSITPLSLCRIINTEIVHGFSVILMVRVLKPFRQRMANQRNHLRHMESHPKVFYFINNWRRVKSWLSYFLEPKEVDNDSFNFIDNFIVGN